MKFDVLVAGEINPDLILSDGIELNFGQRESLIDNAVLSMGSSSVIFAAGLVKLGLRVTFIGLCGDDIFGKFMLTNMKNIGIDTSNVITKQGERTGLSVILLKENDRAILTYPGLIPEFSVEMIPDDLLSQAKHLHVASYFLQTKLQEGLPKLFKKARKLGLTTSLDTNWDPTDKWLGMDRILKHTTIFLPNEKEALAISKKNTLSDALSDLSKESQIIVIKRGSDGAILQSGNKICKASALKSTVVDTIGAGDSFDAGFIYGFLNHWDLQRSLKLGIACGSLSTRTFGGIESQPTLDEAIRYV